MEVIKQFYDIRKTYFSVSETELGYRKSKKTPRDELCIGSRGKLEPKDFPSYVQGTRDIGNHIFDRNTNLDALKSEQIIK